MRLLLLLALSLSSVAMGEELPRVVVLDLQTDPSSKDAAKIVTESVLTELSRTKRFEVIGSSDVQAMIGLERQRELLGCSDQATSCLAEISGALGAQFLVTGALGKIGKSQRLDLKLIDTKTSKVLVREGGLVTEDTLADKTNEALKAIIAALPSPTATSGGEVSEPSGPSKPLAPKLLTGAGAVVALAGFGFGYMSATKFDPTGVPYSDAAEQQRAAQTNATIGYAAMGVGLAMVAGGVAWWALADETPAVAIVPTEGGAFASVSVRFGGAR